MVQITYANIFSEPRNNVVSLISNLDNVSDPVSGSAENRKWIYSRFPDVKSLDFAGYPFIVIKSSDIDTEISDSTADGKSKIVNFDIDIEIYTSDRGYGYDDGRGLVNMEAISNDIFKTLMNIANRKILKGYGLAFANVEPTAISEQALKNEMIYKRIFPLTFQNRMKVSA